MNKLTFYFGVLNFFLSSSLALALSPQELARTLSALQASESGAVPWRVYSDKEIPFEQLYPLYHHSYDSIGHLHPNAKHMKSYGYSHVLVTTDPEHPNRPASYVGFKETKEGLKVITLGQDGSAPGKASLQGMLGRLKNTPGSYIEVSGAPASIVFRNNPPAVVPLDQVVRLIPKDIRKATPSEIEEAIRKREIPDKEEFKQACYKHCYVRSLRINGEKRTFIKLMVGRPLLEAQPREQVGWMRRFLSCFSGKCQTSNPERVYEESRDKSLPPAPSEESDSSQRSQSPAAGSAR